MISPHFCLFSILMVECWQVYMSSSPYRHRNLLQLRRCRFIICPLFLMGLEIVPGQINEQ